MAAFFQAVAAVLIAVLLGLAIKKQNADMSLLLCMAVCALVAAAAMGFLRPVMTFVDKLMSIGDLDEEVMQIIFKAVGIGILAELTEMICTDSGNGAMGKAVHLLSGAVILWLSLPVFTSFVALVQQILEGI